MSKTIDIFFLKTCAFNFYYMHVINLITTHTYTQNMVFMKKHSCKVILLQNKESIIIIGILSHRSEMVLV